MKRWHILIVDDDPEIGDLLGRFLQSHNLDVSVFRDARALSGSAVLERFDLIVLDIMMPGEDGITVCRRLRQSTDCPVILLSARGDEVDRIIGMEAGADDYVAKPFHPRELLARINAVLRRSKARPAAELLGQQEILRFAGWTMNLTRRTVVDAEGQEIDLSGSEYELLKTMAENPHEILTRDQLMSEIRGRQLEVFERTIDIHLSRVRRKLGDKPPRPTLIKTVRNIGYVFSSPVERCLVTSSDEV